MTTSKTTKATRATILLGDQEIEGYQMPDGSYKVSTQTLKDTLDSLIGNSTGKKYLKPLLEASKSMVQARIEGYSRLICLYGLDTFSEVVAVYAKLGNPKAIAILIACVAESLERRFDNAFGVKRTEEERNQRLQSRRDGIVSRHFWTDTIEIYIETHPDVSDNYKKFIYIHVSDLINNAVLGTTAKKYVQPLLEANSNQVNSASVEGIKSHLKTLSLDLVSDKKAPFIAKGAIINKHE